MASVALRRASHLLSVSANATGGLSQLAPALICGGARFPEAPSRARAGCLRGFAASAGTGAASGASGPPPPAGSSSGVPGGRCAPADPSSSPSAATTHFGYREVPLESKAGLVRGVFDAVAPQYDLMNDVMSAGLHRLWKDRLVAQLRPFAGMVHLDVAGGTGDVAARVLDAIREAERGGRGGLGAWRGPSPAAPQPPGRVLVADINAAMLEVGRRRHPQEGLQWLVADAEALPIADASVDAYTIAFGIRNVSRPDAALREARR